MRSNFLMKNIGEYSSVNDRNRIGSKFSWSKVFNGGTSQTNLALPPIPRTTFVFLTSLFSRRSQPLSGDGWCSSVSVKTTKTHLNLVSQDGQVANQREDDADCRGGGGGGGDRHLKAEGQKRSSQKEEH